MRWSVINKIGLVLFYLLFYSCTPAPRYNSNSGKAPLPSIKKETVSKNKQKSSTNKSNTNSKNKKKQPKFDENKKVYQGLSSYYGKDFHGKLTANGEVYDMYGLTAAHKTFPLNTICRVTNLANGKSLILRINDRVPYVGDRILDCSYGAAKKLDFIIEGVTEVKIEIMEWGDNVYMHHDRH